MDTIDKINALLMARGKTGAEMSRDLGLSNATYSKWNTRKSRPSKKVIPVLADYFGVSPMELVADDIVGRSAPLSEENEKSPAPSAGTEDIMKIYSMLTPDRQKQLRSALADLLKEQLQD